MRLKDNKSVRKAVAVLSPLPNCNEGSNSWGGRGQLSDHSSIFIDMVVLFPKDLSLTHPANK